MYSTLLLDCRDAIATITLNRPDKRNAVTAAAPSAITRAMNPVSHSL